MQTHKHHRRDTRGGVVEGRVWKRQELDQLTTCIIAVVYCATLIGCSNAFCGASIQHRSSRPKSSIDFDAVLLECNNLMYPNIQSATICCTQTFRVGFVKTTEPVQSARKILSIVTFCQKTQLSLTLPSVKQKT
jgi:hypothetical protein